jgi:group I intron endonuclease
LSEKTCGVYCLTNKLSGRQYVGKSVDIRKRWENHRNPASRKPTSAIHSALRKYGPDAFAWEVLEECDSEAEALDAEQYWIEWYGSLAPNGYNLTTGGEGWSLSPHERARRAALRCKCGKAVKGRCFSRLSFAPKARSLREQLSVLLYAVQGIHPNRRCSFMQGGWQ